MRATTSVAASAMAFFGMTAASSVGSAFVTIEASHGGAGNGLTNTTVVVPIGDVFTSEALDAVSTLYLTGVDGAVSEDAVSCTPYKEANGTGNGGLPFDIDTPSLLSTNTVVVGSLVCTAGL